MKINFPLRFIFSFVIFAFNFFGAQAQTWSTPVLVETPAGTGGVTGQYSSMLIVNGNPAIAYYDATHKNLMYVRALDASGTTWAAPISIDAKGDVGSHASMQIVNGNPAISYFDATNGDLKYVRALDASGSAWAAPLVIEDGNPLAGVGKFNSLIVVSGNPAISYLDSYCLGWHFITYLTSLL
jgi:hypothetical protein